MWFLITLPLYHRPKLSQIVLALLGVLCDNNKAAISICPHRLAVRTRPFQGRNTGSIPVGGTMKITEVSVGEPFLL